MGLLSRENSQKKIYDRIRKKWVTSTPEEIVRQSLVAHMVENLHYPPHLITVEKELSSLSPHFLDGHQQTPKRRIDILVFASKSLTPLLIVECKATPLTAEFITQVIGYNAFVGAPCIALASQTQSMTGVYDSEIGTYRFQQGLPLFHHLNKLS